MKLLDYHSDFNNYVTCVLAYQVIVKPFMDKHNFSNLATRCKITIILLAWGLTLIAQRLLLLLKQKLTTR